MRKKEFVSKYSGIGDLLQASSEKSEIILTFNQIEKKAGKLPLSAKKFHTWWANNRTPKAPCRHSRVWLSKGYVVKYVDLKKKEVCFIKERTARKKLCRAEVILKAARKLYEEGKKSFTRKEIAIEISHLFPKISYKIASLDAAIQAMQEGSNSARLVGKNWRDTLVHLKRGYFALTEKGLKAKKERIRETILKDDMEVIKEKLERETKTNFLKKDLKLNKNLTLPLDLWSEEKSMGVKIYSLREKKVKENSRTISKILSDFNLMQRAKIEKPIFILKKNKMRKPLKEKLIKDLKPFLKNLKVYLFEKNKTRGQGNLIKL